MRQAFVIAFGISLLAGHANADARIASGSVTLMDGPWETARSVQPVSTGTRVELMEIYQGWGLIRLPSGMTGWARATSLVRPGAYRARAVKPAAPVPAPIEDVDAYTSVVWPPKGNLNLRRGPGTNHSVDMVMVRGDIVEVFQKSGNWVKVRCITGEIGWTYAAYLSR